MTPVKMTPDDFASSLRAVRAREAAQRHAEVMAQDARAMVMRAVSDEFDVMTELAERYPAFQPGMVDYRPDVSQCAWVPVDKPQDGKADV